MLSISLKLKSEVHTKSISPNACDLLFASEVTL